MMMTDANEVVPRTGVTRDPAVRTIAICDTQPVTAEGVRTLLAGSPDLRFGHVCDSLQQASDCMRAETPDVLVLDKAFGTQAILDWLSDWKAKPNYRPGTGIVVWGCLLPKLRRSGSCRRAHAESCGRRRASSPLFLACGQLRMDVAGWRIASSMTAAMPSAIPEAN